MYDYCVIIASYFTTVFYCCEVIFTAWLLPLHVFIILVLIIIDAPCTIIFTCMYELHWYILVLQSFILKLPYLALLFGVLWPVFWAVLLYSSSFCNVAVYWRIPPLREGFYPPFLQSLRPVVARNSEWRLHCWQASQSKLQKQRNRNKIKKIKVKAKKSE